MSSDLSPQKLPTYRDDQLHVDLRQRLMILGGRILHQYLVEWGRTTRYSEVIRMQLSKTPGRGVVKGVKCEYGSQCLRRNLQVCETGRPKGPLRPPSVPNFYH